MRSGDAPVAIVTGAGRGIGRAIATHLARDGCRIVAVDLAGDSAERAARDIAEDTGVDALSYAADVAEFGRAHEVVGDVITQLGRVDVLVNNAGLPERSPFLEITEGAWDRTIAVHLKGSFNWCHAVAPSMVEHGFGRIICISSLSAKVGVLPRSRVRTAYAAAKAGMLGLVRGLAVELAPHVTVNAICPGRIETEMTADGLHGPLHEQILADIPAHRLGAPDDIAATVAFLSSASAGYITGEVIDINGGLYID